MKKVYIAPKVTVFVTTIHPLCALSGADWTDKGTGEKTSDDLGGGETMNISYAINCGKLIPSGAFAPKRVPRNFVYAYYNESLCAGKPFSAAANAA